MTGLQKIKLVNDCRKVAIEVKNVIGQDFFSITQLSLRMAIHIDRAKFIVSDLQRMYFLKKTMRNSIDVFKIELDDAERLKLMEEAILTINKAVKVKIEFIEELKIITKADGTSLKKV